MKIRLLIVFVILAFGAIAAPVMAEHFPGEGNTCTTNPKDGSGLPECGTRADNECNPGGVLYREENQDGCPTVWYWKAGWYLARYNDGKIARKDFPKEFESVLPPPPFDDSQTIICWIDLTKEGYGSSIGITKAIMYPKAAWWDDGIHGDVEYGSSGYTWAWHNGPGSYDLGFDFQEWNGPDIHVYSTGSGWAYPVTGNCNPNLSALP